MPKIPSFRATYNQLLSFDMADLKRLGFMIGYCSQSLEWSESGISIHLRVRVDMFDSNNYVELSYQYKDKPVCYRIKLINVPSNLPNGGKLWYFLCPVTGERCRKLYDGGKYFLSRKALINILYESQTHSKFYRFLATMYGPGLKLDEMREDLEKPYVKRYYQGKPTKRMMKYLSLSDVVAVRKEQGYSSIDDLMHF
ncbi:hypothetical protein [Spirosoma sp. KNUC1025]|uniref:hypothetical protein n=1 Tax=Spirosoma sp. KNUC1025 TaxID=2894082 RepID=UPI00386E867B|nr:hypothetical protein LN737_15170 [Spirosoma sp. KNUC1025]